MDSARLSFFAFAIFASLIAISSCSAAERGVSLSGAAKPVGAGSPAKADAKLEEAVRARLAEDGQLRSANLRVIADVTNNQVTLSGIVGSVALKERAAEIAKEAHAGVIVQNKIEVKPKF